MYDVYGVGNALVDSEYLVTEAILAESAFPKSGMSLVDEVSRATLLDLIEQRHGIHRKALASGGSAANTIATVSGLGGKAFYSCKIAGDATGAAPAAPRDARLCASPPRYLPVMRWDLARVVFAPCSAFSMWSTYWSGVNPLEP
mgnify:CR=1 FL=1